MLKLNILIFMALTGGVLILNSSGAAQTPPVSSSISSRVLGEARVRNKINWGLRTVTPPISFQNNYGQWQGFCTDLIALLENYLKDNQLVRNDFKIERYAISLENRFKYTRFPYQPNQQLRLDGECGSDTTRQDQKGIKFSSPYFNTRTLLLMPKSNSNKFLFLRQRFSPSNVPKPKIGFLNGSITGNRLERFFQNSEVDIVNIKGGSHAAIDSLLSGEVDALANNEIFLNEMLLTLNKNQNANEFYVDSQIISRETYGLILPGDDEQWVKVINDFLFRKQKDIQELLKKHITSQNLAELSDIENLKPKTSNREWMFILLLTLCIVIVFGLTYRYWVRRQNSLSLTQPSIGTLDLYHNQVVDSRAIAIALEKLAENHPDAKLRIVEVEVQGKDKFLVRVDTAITSDKSELKAEYFDTYNEIKSLSDREIKALMAEKDSRIISLENFVTQALQRPNYYSNTQIQEVGAMNPNQGGINQSANNSQIGGEMQAAQGNNNQQNMSNETYRTKYDQSHANIGGFVDTAQSGSQVTFTQNNNYTPEQKQSLAEAAAEIQKLLYQLTQNNQTNDEQVTKAIHDEIKNNPTLKARLQSALKAGGLEALKAIFNHPLFNIPAETIKGFIEAE
jgi:ABC-type amino acid transport substrate-binding protein